MPSPGVRNNSAHWILLEYCRDYQRDSRLMIRTSGGQWGNLASQWKIGRINSSLDFTNSCITAKTERDEIYHLCWSAKFILKCFRCVQNHQFHPHIVTNRAESPINPLTIAKITENMFRIRKQQPNADEKPRKCVDNCNIGKSKLMRSTWGRYLGPLSINWTPGIRDKVNKTNWKMRKMARAPSIEGRNVANWLNLNVLCTVHFSNAHVFWSWSNLI